MNRRKILLSLLAFCVLLLAGACQTDPGITRADLIGTWDRPDDSITYNDDGTYRVGVPFGGVDKITAQVGQFRLEGRLLTFKTSDDSAFCAGLDGSYEVEMVEQDELLLTLREDDCLERSIIVMKPASGQRELHCRSPKQECDRRLWSKHFGTKLERKEKYPLASFHSRRFEL